MTGPTGRLELVSALAAALLAVAVYLPGLPGEFVYDDHRLIVDNAGLKRPLDVRRSFLRDYYASDDDRMGLGYYRPLTLLSTEMDYRRGGGSAAPFHATNIAIHAGCTLLVFLLGRRLLGRGIGPAAAAFLFAAHPAHAESVAFISGRVDPLATLFGLAALVCHLSASGSRAPWRWRGAAAVLWLGALLSKEIAVAVPPIAFVLDLAVEGMPKGRQWIARLRGYLPYAAVAAVYLALRVVALGALLPVAAKAAVAWTRPPVVVGTYLTWLVAPPWRVNLEPGLAAGAAAAGATAVAALTVAAAVLLVRAGRRVEAALLAWVLLALLPVAQLRPLETDLSERFLYLASAGAMLLAGAVLARLAAGSRGRVGAAALALVATAVYCGHVIPRARTWRNEIALWSAMDAEEGGRSLKAKLNLGRAYAARGDHERAAGAYEAAATLDPALAPAIRAESGSVTERPGSEDYERSLRQGLQAQPTDGAMWNNLGFQLLATGRTDEAIAAFEKAVTLTPARGTAWLGLALGRSARHDWVGADTAAARAAELDPALALARAVRVQCAVSTGRACEALALAQGLSLDDPAEQARLDALTARAREACRR